MSNGPLSNGSLWMDRSQRIPKKITIIFNDTEYGKVYLSVSTSRLTYYAKIFLPWLIGSAGLQRKAWNILHVQFTKTCWDADSTPKTRLKANYTPPPSWIQIRVREAIYHSESWCTLYSPVIASRLSLSHVGYAAEMLFYQKQ